MFYEYIQNNSGGSFVEDAESGVSHIVIIEADDSTEADYRAERIGLYFNGCDLGWDCDCCGDRWYPQGLHDEGTQEPEYYGRIIVDGVMSPAEDNGFLNNYKWMKGPEGYIHYKDGRIESFDF